MDDIQDVSAQTGGGKVDFLAPEKVVRLLLPFPLATGLYLLTVI